MFGGGCGCQTHSANIWEQDGGGLVDQVNDSATSAANVLHTKVIAPATKALKIAPKAILHTVGTIGKFIDNFYSTIFPLSSRTSHSLLLYDGNQSSPTVFS